MRSLKFRTKSSQQNGRVGVLQLCKGGYLYPV